MSVGGYRSDRFKLTGRTLVELDWTSGGHMEAEGRLLRGHGEACGPACPAAVRWVASGTGTRGRVTSY